MLEPRHLIAVNQFLKGANKRDSLKYAGYSKSYADKTPGEVFDRPEVVAEIKRRQEMMAKRADVDADWVIERLKAIASANLDSIMEIQEDGSARYNLKLLTPEMSVALGEMSVDTYSEGRGPNSRAVKRMKIKQLDKLRALEMLARTLGLFDDKMTVKGEMSIVERLNRGRHRAGKTDEENDRPDNSELS